MIQSQQTKGRWGPLTGMRWWQVVLSILPMTLMLVGGALGAIIGLGGLGANAWIVRSRLPIAVKIPAALVVTAACITVYWLIGSAILHAMRG